MPDINETEVQFYRADQLAWHPDAHPVALDYWVLSKFDISDFLTWEPETLWQEIGYISGRTPSESTKNKIQALRTVHLNTLPFSAWEVFEKIMQAFDGVIPQFEEMQPPSLGQLYAGVDALWRVRAEKFGDEVKQYCAATFLTNGVLYAPPPLDSINILLTGISPSGGRRQDDVRARMKDPAVVLQEDDPIDMQARKLRLALEYMDKRREAMTHQLTVLRRAVAEGIDDTAAAASS